jgi:hypothetical protein
MHFGADKLESFKKHECFGKVKLIRVEPEVTITTLRGALGREAWKK